MQNLDAVPIVNETQKTSFKAENTKSEFVPVLMSTVKKKNLHPDFEHKHHFPCPISALQLLKQLNSFVTTDSNNKLNKEQKIQFLRFVLPGFCLPGFKNADQQTLIGAEKQPFFTTLFKTMVKGIQWC